MKYPFIITKDNINEKLSQYLIPSSYEEISKLLNKLIKQHEEYISHKNTTRLIISDAAILNAGIELTDFPHPIQVVIKLLQDALVNLNQLPQLELVNPVRKAITASLALIDSNECYDNAWSWATALDPRYSLNAHSVQLRRQSTYTQLFSIIQPELQNLDTNEGLKVGIILKDNAMIFHKLNAHSDAYKYYATLTQDKVARIITNFVYADKDTLSEFINDSKAQQFTIVW